MSGIALIGSVSFLLRQEVLDRLVLPLVALAAGSLIGGALFHMLPAALSSAHLDALKIGIWLAAGFTVFFALEQFIHHHHCHRKASDCKKPFGYLVLIGDGFHNLLGGMAVAGTFLVDIRLGIATWIAAAAHEIPQELGDFGALVYSGWSRKKALLWNFASALMFPVGGLLTYFLSFQIQTDFLIAFAAGNFIYIGASDLVPEVNKARTIGTNIIHFSAFVSGLLMLLSIHFFLHH
ncbi:MAG: ZIP family metal transporter [Candidatus Omnitrophica bacterium]|nr:ZIP family metal transporter [Candidatus Omnitrophota bacterium]